MRTSRGVTATGMHEPHPAGGREGTPAGAAAHPDAPTAIFAGHDDIALGALAAVTAAGRPVSVAGYDNTDLAAHPLIGLTSLDQEGVEMGAQAATMLLERFQGRTEPRKYVATTSLQARRSTRPVSAS